VLNDDTYLKANLSYSVYIHAYIHTYIHTINKANMFKLLSC